MYTLQRRLQGVGITVSSLNPGRVGSLVVVLLIYEDCTG